MLPLVQNIHDLYERLPSLDHPFCRIEGNDGLALLKAYFLEILESSDLLDRVISIKLDELLLLENEIGWRRKWESRLLINWSTINNSTEWQDALGFARKTDDEYSNWRICFIYPNLFGKDLIGLIIERGNIHKDKSWESHPDKIYLAFCTEDELKDLLSEFSFEYQIEITRFLKECTQIEV